MNRYIWAGVGIVVLAYALMAFVSQFLPLFITGVVLLGLFNFIFKKRW